MCQYSLPSLPSPSSPGEEILRFQRQFVARLGPSNTFAPPPGREAKSLVSLPAHPKSRLVPRTLLPRDPRTALLGRDPNKMLPSNRLPSSSSSSTDSGAFSRNSTPEPLLHMQEQVQLVSHHKLTAVDWLQYDAVNLWHNCTAHLTLGLKQLQYTAQNLIATMLNSISQLTLARLEHLLCINRLSS